MATWTVADTVVGPSGPVNGAVVYLWKASRTWPGGQPPAQGAAAPTGVADAGPVTTGTTYGGPGAFQIAAPTSESYYAAITYGGVTYWKLYNDVNFTDGATSSKVQTNDNVLDDGSGDATVAGTLAVTGVSTLTGVVTEPAGRKSTAITSGALPTVAGGFSSGTGKQVLTTRDTTLCVSFTTSTSAGTVAVALSPDNNTYSSVFTVTPGVNASVSDIVIPVPAGWYVKFTFTNGTLGTATYY